MTTEEQKVVEEAAKKHELFSSIRGDKYSFVKGAEFMSNLRKPSEESIMLAKRIICTMDDWMQFDENDVLENLEEVATEIAKLLQPDVNMELLEAAKRLSFLHGCEQEGMQNGMPTPNEWLKAVDALNDAISNYEKQK